jgi:hypothetical protein
MRRREETDAHTRIEQMLTESRVILPGTQAMLGFQLIVTITKPFDEMAEAVKYSKFAALGMMIFGVVLLIAPATVHRLSFGGGMTLDFIESVRGSLQLHWCD